MPRRVNRLHDQGIGQLGPDLTRLTVAGDEQQFGYLGDGGGDLHRGGVRETGLGARNGTNGANLETREDPEAGDAREGGVGYAPSYRYAAQCVPGRIEDRRRKRRRRV